MYIIIIAVYLVGVFLFPKFLDWMREDDPASRLFLPWIWPIVFILMLLVGILLLPSFFWDTLNGKE